MFIGATVLCGVVGNLLGGVVFDRVTHLRGIRFAGRVIGAGAPFCAAALMLGMTQIHQKVPS